MNRSNPHMVLAVSLASVGAVLMPEASLACATCFGAADSPMTEGMNKAILLLLGIVGLVQVGFVKLFWNIRKRTRMLAERRNKFRLVNRGSP